MERAKSPKRSIWYRSLGLFSSRLFIERSKRTTWVKGFNRSSRLKKDKK